MFQSEICDLNGILNRKKFNNNFWLIKVRNYWQKTSLNQFKPVGAHSSELIDLEKVMVLQKHNFLLFLT